MVAVDQNAQTVEKTRLLIEQEGGVYHALTVDVSQEQQVREAIVLHCKTLRPCRHPPQQRWYFYLEADHGNNRGRLGQHLGCESERSVLRLQARYSLDG